MILIVIVSAVFFAEFVGYWLHVLIHSEKIPFLSRSHMIHHLVIYPPDKPQRQTTTYLDSTYDRASVLGLGMEWVIPAAILIGGLLAAFAALGVGALHQAVFIGVALSWSTLMFWYMHDAMHIRGFWMEGDRLWSRWFLKVRRRHDIHHMRIDDSGLMRTNYGICFFLFDSMFGTFADRHEKFNPEGYAAAKQRYRFVLGG